MPTMRLNGIEVYYEDEGKGDPLIFIHGLGSSSRDWQAQTGFFSKRYRTLAYDVRGHGRTEKPPGPYSVSLFSDDAAHLIRAREASPAHIVGLSMGGMIAFQLVLDHPDLVKSMVIVNSGPAFVVKTLSQQLMVLQRFFIARVLGMRAMGKFLSRRLFPEPGQRDLKRTMINRWQNNDRGAYIASFKAIVGWNVLDRLSEITCPTLVIAAEYDYTPPEIKQSYVSLMQNAELKIVAGSRHLTPVDQSLRFNEVLEAFLSSKAEA